MPTAIDESTADDCLTPSPEKRQATELRYFALRLMADWELSMHRLSNTLHDDLGQSLLTLNLDLYTLRRTCRASPRALARVSKMRKAIEQMSRTVRRLAADFRPAPQRTNIDDVLAAVAERFRAEVGVSCKWRTKGCESAVEPLFAVALYRLLLQALTCAAATGTAATEVFASVEDGAVTFVIEESELCVRDARIGLAAALEDLRDWISALGGRIQLNRMGQSREIVRLVLPLR